MAAHAPSYAAQFRKSRPTSLQRSQYIRLFRGVGGRGFRPRKPPLDNGRPGEV